MGDTARGKGIAEGANHGLLADQVLEGARTIFAGQHLIGITGPGIAALERRGRGHSHRRGRLTKHIVGIFITNGSFSLNRVVLIPRGGVLVNRLGHFRLGPRLARHRRAAGPVTLGTAHRLSAGGNGWRLATTRSETRCGCFLPDLTGLARTPPATNLHALYVKAKASMQGVRVDRCTPPTPASPVLPPEGEDLQTLDLPPLGEVAQSAEGGLVVFTTLHQPYCSSEKVIPVLACKRSIKAWPRAAAGVQMPPGVFVRSTSSARHRALSAIILEVQP